MGIIRGGEPFLFKGGPVGCLLVHGFTGAPKEMVPLAENLAAQGHTVLGPRLFGHATDPLDMSRARWIDWLIDVEDGYYMLRGSCDQVVVMGLSMGGVLSLLFSASFPVDGVVAMSTPAKLTDPRLRFAKFLSFFWESAPKGPPDWHDPELEEDHVSYPSYPVRALAELRDLMAQLPGQLPKVSAPALVIHSTGDLSVPSEDAEYIYEHLGSSDKKLVWVEDSGHVVTRDKGKQQVLDAVTEFIQRVAGANG